MSIPMIDLKQRWFENAPMGQRARLVTLPSETDGRPFVLEYINRPRAGEFAVPPSLHPPTARPSRSLRGQARYRLGKESGTAGPGDKV